MFPKIKKVEQLMAYFPEYKNGQLPDKKYFYSVMWTIFPDYMKDVIIASHKKHNDKLKREENNVIKITPEFLESLNSVDFKSSKNFQSFDSNRNQGTYCLLAQKECKSGIQAKKEKIIDLEIDPSVLEKEEEKS